MAMAEPAGLAERIRSAVLRRYGEAARRLGSQAPDGSSRCGSPVLTRAAGATPKDVPEELACSSFGCGDPIALASLTPANVVLDLGSGSGLDVLRAARHVGPKGFVYGLDMTDEMLLLATGNAHKMGVANVAFLKGDIEDIPLPEASVDVVISNCAINLAPDKRRVFREAWRVLRPGGRLAVSDIVIHGGFQGLPLGEEQIRRLLMFSWSHCVAGALTDEQYRRQLVEAGFERIRIEVRHRYSVGDLVPRWRTAATALTPRAIQKIVARFTSSAITALRPCAAELG